MSIYGANPVDVVVLIIVLVSGLLALVRGFVAEILTIIGLSAAVGAALYGMPHVAPYIEPHLAGIFKGDSASKEAGLTANAIAAVLLFMGTISVTSAISYVVSRRIHKTNLSAIDRSLGFLFGLLRGAMIVSLFYICVTFVFPAPKEGETPEPGSMQAVLRDARTGPALAAGARVIASFAPDKGLTIEELTSHVDPLKELVQPQAEAHDKPSDENRGYGENAREDLNSVINRATSQGDQNEQR